MCTEWFWGEIIGLGSRRAVVIYLVVVVILLGVVGGVSRLDLNSLVLKGNPDGRACNVSMRIVTPTWSTDYVSARTANVSVAAFLDEGAAALNISVQKEYWTGYHSYFVVGIHGEVNGEGGRYWQYYVNGDLPMVGCSQYVLQDNDRVEWRFEKPSWIS